MTESIRRQKSSSQPLPKTVGDIRQVAARGAKAHKGGAKVDKGGATGGKVLYGQAPAAPRSLRPTEPSQNAAGFLAALARHQGGSQNPLVQEALEALKERDFARRQAEFQRTKDGIQFVEYPKESPREAPPAVSVHERIARGELVHRDPVPQPRPRQPAKGG